MELTMCQGSAGGPVRRGVLLALVAAVLSSALGAEPGPPAPPPKQADPTAVFLTPEAIQGRMKQAEASKELADDVKKTVLGLYTQSLDQLKQAVEQSARAAEYDALRKGAPELLAALKAELAKPPEEPKPVVPPDASLATLEQATAEVEAGLAAAKRKAADMEAEAKRRTERRTETPKQLATVRQELDEVAQQLAAKAEEGQPQELARANRTLLLVRKRAAEGRISLIEKAVLSADARTELFALQRDQFARQIAQSEKLLKAWQELVSDYRRKDAERAAREAREARRAAATAHPAVRKLAEENAQLAERRTGPQGLTAQIEAVSGQLQQATSRLAALKDELRNMKEKERAAAGLTHSFALLLRRKRAGLPDLRAYRRSVGARQEEISLAQLALIDLEEQRSKLGSIEAGLKEVLSGLDEPIPKEQQEDFQTAIKEQLETRRNYVAALLADYNRCFANLVDLDAAERQVIAETQGAIAYIDERILWVRSASPLSLAVFPKLWEALGWLASPAGWIAVFATLGSDVKENPALYLLLLLLVASLLRSRGKLRARLEAMSERLHKPDTDSFTDTLVALVISVLRCLPRPLVVWFVAWRLNSSVAAPDFVKAAAWGLFAAAKAYLLLAFLRQVCRPNGLGEAHFRWHSDVVDLVHRNLLVLSAAVVPTIFIGSTLAWQANDALGDSLGRLAFIIRMLAVVWFMHALFRPGGKLMTEVIGGNTARWLNRLRHVWYPLAVLLPIVLATLAAMGYYYMAQQLGQKLEASLLLAAGVILVQALAIRGLHVLYQRLAAHEAMARRLAAATALASGAAMEKGSATAEHDSLHVLSRQTRRLVDGLTDVALIVGLWVIWSEVFPALNVLKRFGLWATGTGVITLADLAAAVLVVIVTVIASRNLPSLLEIIILHRLPMDHGMRFAITSICRYLIVVVGVAVGLGAIGIGWSKVQWLVAAITVGLGFGLQEIFANFISGLIILFERPMRVGDTVTVGDITGTVTDIRIRATTILDWDRKELIVPNKEFITGRLVNWTLSDSIVRVTFPVGIAYGSDTALAERVLMEVAQKCPFALREPKPSVLFKGFGNSSLDFELRAFIPDMTVYWKSRHHVNMAIDAAFRQAGIEIAFPQQDIHVRSVEPRFPIPAPEIHKAPGAAEGK